VMHVMTHHRMMMHLHVPVHHRVVVHHGIVVHRLRIGRNGHSAEGTQLKKREKTEESDIRFSDRNASLATCFFHHPF